MNYARAFDCRPGGGVIIFSKHDDMYPTITRLLERLEVEMNSSRLGHQMKTYKRAQTLQEVLGGRIQCSSLGKAFLSGVLGGFTHTYCHVLRTQVSTTALMNISYVFSGYVR